MNIQQFNYSIDLLQAILWQYDEATSLVSLIKQKQAWYNTNQTQFWTDWYNNVFNLMTANAFGISVWSYILNVPLYIIFTPEPSTKPVWGFNQIVGSWPTLENSYRNFGHGNFSTKSSLIPLSVEEQRFLLRLRYFQLTTRADITDINLFLDNLVRSSSIGFTGRIYVLDNLDMSMTYTITNSTFPGDLLTIIQTLDIMPRPAGVSLTYSIL